ncbi:Wound-induced basic protein, partial [Mucuna pruriens]
MDPKDALSNNENSGPTKPTGSGSGTSIYSGRLQQLCSTEKKIRVSSLPSNLLLQKTTMIYDVNSPLFRSFLSQKGGASDKRKTDEQKPKEQRPKASENKPIMTE